MIEKLPPNWEVAPLGDLLEPLDDGRPIHQGWSPQCESRPSRSDDEWAVLKTTAIQSGNFLPQHNKMLPTSLQPRPWLEVRNGDMLITCAGPRARCGVACLVRSTRPRLMMSGKIYRIRFNKNYLLSSYLELYFRSASAWREIDRMKTGVSDSGLNLTQARFRTLPIPVAPLAEQTRIVAATEEHFSRLDAAEATLRQTITRLDTLRSSVLADAFHAHRKLPDSWWTAQLEDLLDYSIGGIWGSPAGEDEHDVDVIRVTELQDHGALSMRTAARRSITKRQLSSRLLREGDLILEKSGGGPTKPVGRVARFPGHTDDAICTNFMQLMRPSAAVVDSRFLHLQLHYRYVSGATAAMNKGSGNIRNLQTREYLRQLVALSPMHEQTRISRDIGESFDQARQLELVVNEVLERIVALRRSVLAAAFSGQLVPQALDDEPASVLLERIAASRPEQSTRRGART